MAGRSGTYRLVKEQAVARFFCPAPLPPDPPVVLAGELQVVLDKAGQAVNRLEDLVHFLPQAECCSAMYLRREALASLELDGTRASFEALLALEYGDQGEEARSADRVLRSLASMHEARKRPRSFPMSVWLIKKMHAGLMSDPEWGPGEFRVEPLAYPGQGKTFGPSAGRDLAEAMQQLEAFLNRSSELPVLVSCALVHYQMAAIRPFRAGNTLMARQLISLYLHWRGVLSEPFLCLSNFFKKNRQEYSDGLNRVRDEDDYEQWLFFFLQGVVEAAEHGVAIARNILLLQAEHRSLLWQRQLSSPLAVGLLETLFERPYLAIHDVARDFGISFQAASLLVARFETIGILREITGRKRGRRYVYSSYLALFGEPAAEQKFGLTRAGGVQ